MYAGRDLAEVVELMPRLDVNDREVWIRRFEARTVLVAAICLHCEIAVNAGYDDIARRRAQRAVDDEQVAVVDALSDHRVALDADEERGGRPPHEKLVEVERRLEILLGRRGKPRHDGTGNFSLRAHNKNAP